MKQKKLSSPGSSRDVRSRNVQVSIVVVAFNSKNDLARLLPSVFQQKGVRFEVFVVDNASQDNTASWLKKHYPQVKLITNHQNRGFSAANNQAIKKAQGRWIFLLNPDTRLKKDCLKNLVDWFETHPEEKLAGCLLLNPDGSLQPSGGFAPTLFRLFCWTFFIDDLPLLRRFLKPYQARHLSFYRRSRPFDWLMGAALVVDRSLFEKIGFLDEKIFMYAEEVEFCYRAKKAGFSTWLIPQAQVVHWGQDPAGPRKENAVLGEYQGLKYFFQKHRPAWQFPLLRFLLKVNALLRLFLFGKIMQDRRLGKIYEKAFRLA